MMFLLKLLLFRLVLIVKSIRLTEYDCDVKGYDVKIFRDAESFHTVFMQRSLFERIAAKSNY